MILTLQTIREKEVTAASGHHSTAKRRDATNESRIIENNITKTSLTESPIIIAMIRERESRELMRDQSFDPREEMSNIARRNLHGTPPSPTISTKIMGSTGRGTRATNVEIISGTNGIIHGAIIVMSRQVIGLGMFQRAWTDGRGEGEAPATTPRKARVHRSTIHSRTTTSCSISAEAIENLAEIKQAASILKEKKDTKSNHKATDRGRSPVEATRNQRAAANVRTHRQHKFRKKRTRKISKATARATAATTPTRTTPC